MKKFLVAAVMLLTVVAFGAGICAEQVPVQPAAQCAPESCAKGKFKVEGYAEYISFMGGDIDNSTWGGGILARYLFLDWLGVQTNFSFYGDVGTEAIGGDLSFTNWRLSLILHSYLSEVSDKLYIYGGGGVGVQFNDDVGSVGINDPITGHVLAGLGYDLTEVFSLEAEVGYQFGKADATNFTDDNIGVEALFVRAGAGLKF